MARPQFYRFFPGDYLRDAAHLSLLEHGVYRRMIDLYMTTGEPLAFDMQRLYRLLHATSKEEQQAVEQVVEEFFRMDGSLLRHNRCDREIQWQIGMSAAQSERAKLSWKTRKKKKLKAGAQPDHSAGLPAHSSGNASQSQSQSQSQRKEQDQDLPANVDPSSELWSFGVEVLTRDGKKPLTDNAARMFIGSLRKTWTDEVLVDALRAAIGTDDPKAYACAILKKKPTAAELSTQPKEGDTRTTKWGLETFYDGQWTV